jgi:hypothetical protein
MPISKPESNSFAAREEATRPAPAKDITGLVISDFF